MACKGEFYYRALMRMVHPLHRLIPPLLDIEEKRKRLFVFGAGLLSIPILVLYTFLDYHNRDNLSVVMDVISLVLITFSTIVLVKIRNGIWIYRLMIGTIMVLLSYIFLVGSHGESSVMWMFSFPLVVFFILGLPEGFIWLGAVLLFGLMAFGFPQVFHTFHYEHDTEFVYFLLLGVFACLSIGFEVLRWYFYTRLEQQRTELKDALENVRTLSGLLPICSACKKIRDDRGYWNQLESYLSRHTDAKLTHGICDDCFQTLYPEIYALRGARKAAEAERVAAAGDAKR